jgi:hypothetical protein
MPNEVLLIGVGPKGRYSLTEETLKLLGHSNLYRWETAASQFKDLTAKTVDPAPPIFKGFKLLKRVRKEHGDFGIGE